MAGGALKAGRLCGCRYCGQHILTGTGWAVTYTGRGHWDMTRNRTNRRRARQGKVTQGTKRRNPAVTVYGACVRCREHLQINPHTFKCEQCTFDTMMGRPTQQEQPSTAVMPSHQGA